MLHKTLTLTISLALCLGLTPVAFADYQASSGYTAAEGAIIWCGAEPHALTPQGTPTGDPGQLPSWALSGEPECAAADVLNELGDERQDQGIGGTAFLLPAGTVATALEVRTVDDVFGADASYLSLTVHTEAGTASAEGCGPQSPTLDDEDPWNSAPTEQSAILWVAIPPVGMEPDLQVCFASHGTATAATALSL